MQTLIAILAFFMVSLLHAAPVASIIAVDASKTIVLTAQQPSFSIKLSANPSTGYSWKIKSFDNRYFKLDFQRHIPPNLKLMGAVGTTLFGFSATPEAFKVTKPLFIVFVYNRPWKRPSWDKGEDTPVTFKIVTVANAK